MEKEIVDMSRYEVGDILGKGSFGKVYAVKDVITKKHYAMKIIWKGLPKFIKTKEEVNIHSKFNHPGIVKIVFSFETDEDVIIIMEKCAENLYEMEKNYPEGLSEEEAMEIFSQIINAVSYIHDQGYAHRDIKPENVIKCQGNVWKLIDFGFTVPKDTKLDEICCTVDYVAPEATDPENFPYLGQPTDIWALGVLLYEMLFGKLPFYQRTIRETYLSIQIHSLIFTKEINPKIKGLLELMLEKDPKIRITIEEVVKMTKEI